jgi:hypothetical protein
MALNGMRAVAIGVLAGLMFLWALQTIAAEEQKPTTLPGETAGEAATSGGAEQAASQGQDAPAGESPAHEEGVLHVELKYNEKVEIATNLILMWIGILGLVAILLMKIKEVDRVLGLNYKKRQDASQGH